MGIMHFLHIEQLLTAILKHYPEPYRLILLHWNIRIQTVCKLPLINSFLFLQITSEVFTLQ